MAIVPVKSLDDEEYIKNRSILMATVKGVIKKQLLRLYSRPRRNGIIAINVREGDRLLALD
jgi:DNA gyrase subunit A